MDSCYRYKVYGLNVLSQIAFSELLPGQFESEDVRIEFATLPETLDYAEHRYDWIEFGEGDCLFRIPGIAKYLIRRGKEILVDPARSFDPVDGENKASSQVKMFILGSCFGAIFHQIRAIPLHVSAIASQNGVWAFTGDSGAGKSTIGTYLAKTYGLDLLSDDVGVLRVAGETFKFFPGPRKIKLWDDAARALGIATDKCERTEKETPKYQVLLNHHQVEEGRPLLGVINLLRSGAEQPSRLRLHHGARAFEAACNAVYRPLFARHLRPSEELMTSLARLADNLVFADFERAWDLGSFSTQMEPLESFLGLSKIKSAQGICV